MSELFKGTVQRLNFKDIDEDQYGNVCRVSILLKTKDGEETWVNLGGKKKHEINLKQGQSWHKLQVGDQIELVAEDSEFEGKTYWRASTTTIKVKASAAPQQQQASSASSSHGSQTSSSKTSPVSSGGGVDWAAKDAGAAASASIDKALRYLAVREGEVKTDYTTILSIARDFQGMVKTLAAEIQGKQGPQEPVKPAPVEEPKKAPTPTPPVKAKAKPKKEEEEEFVDDELPF